MTLFSSAVFISIKHIPVLKHTISILFISKNIPSFSLILPGISFYKKYSKIEIVLLHSENIWLRYRHTGDEEKSKPEESFVESSCMLKKSKTYPVEHDLGAA